jgi:hypothetical protein
MTSFRSDPTFRWALAASVATALLVVSPFCFLGQASGHDFQFHVASWMDVARQWHAGVVFPRWAVWANYGYGEPRFIFYPPLSWCLGAALGLFLPWSVVPATFIFLCLVIAGVSMFRLASEWLSPAGTIAATVLYVANPYQMVLVYYRSDFAELLAASLFPLAIHYALCCAPSDIAGRDGEETAHRAHEPLRNIAVLAIVYGAIWLANAPAAVVASYALAVLLAVCAILRRSFLPLFASSAALILGLILAGVYIVPAAYEQAWVNIGQAVSAGFRPAENFLFTWVLDPEHNLVNLEISAVAVLMITLTGIGAAISHHRTRSSRFIWIAMFAGAVMSALLMFPSSGPVWQYAPKLRFVQFPWRWLLPLGVSLAFFLGETVATSRHRLAVALGCVALLTGTGVLIARATYWDSDDLVDILTAVSSGQGYEGTYEYCTLGGDQTDLPLRSPTVVLLPAEPEENSSALPAPQQPRNWSVEDWQPERKVLIVEASSPARAAVRLLNYPAWRVRVNGAPVESESDTDSGQMIVPLPAGRSRVEIFLARTPDRTIGGALSCMAALLLAEMAFAALRRRRKGLRTAQG